MRRLDLDLIPLPCIISQQRDITDKIPPHIAELAELRRILHQRIAKHDTPMPRRKGKQTLERARKRNADATMRGIGGERKRNCILEGVLPSARNVRNPPPPLSRKGKRTS